MSRVQYVESLALLEAMPGGRQRSSYYVPNQAYVPDLVLQAVVLVRAASVPPLCRLCAASSLLCVMRCWCG